MSENIQSSEKKKFTISPQVTALLLALLLFLASGFLPNGFNSVDNAINQAFNILRLSAFLALIAAGQTLVIISGGEGIDLSAGAIVTIAVLFTYKFINGDNAMVLPVLFFVVACGAAIGLFNGLGIAYLKISTLCYDPRYGWSCYRSPVSCNTRSLRWKSRTDHDKCHRSRSGLGDTRDVVSVDYFRSVHDHFIGTHPLW